MNRRVFKSYCFEFCFPKDFSMFYWGLLGFVFWLGNFCFFLITSIHFSIHYGFFCFFKFISRFKQFYKKGKIISKGKWRVVGGGMCRRFVRPILL